MSFMIHWHEGLFLLPHHLQRLQHDAQTADAHNRGLQRAYPYGLINLRLSNDELANRLLRFERLTAVMPSGRLVQFPESAAIATLDLKEPLARHPQGFLVMLGVPLWDPESANTLEFSGGSETRSNLLYVTEERRVRDENTGENPKEILYRKINARVILPGDHVNGLETLPLLRILPGVGQTIGQARVDPDYAPPCLVMNASAALRRIALDLAAQVMASRDSLVSQMGTTPLNMETIRGSQIEQLMRLSALNRASARLPLLAESQHLAPVDFFMELHTLLGDLNALSPGADEFHVKVFDHNDPLPSFRELSERIRKYLIGSVTQSFLTLEFSRQVDCFEAELEDEHLTRPSDYFLGIETKAESRQLVSLVEDPDRFKLMTRKFLNKPIFGIRLKEERIPPVEFPQRAGMHYFRLLKAESGRMWDMLEREKVAAIRWPGLEDSDFRITLYMSVPQ